MNTTKFHNQTIKNLVKDVMHNSLYLDAKGLYWTDYFCRDDDFENPKFKGIFSDGDQRDKDNLDSFTEKIIEDSIKYLELYPHKIAEFSDKNFKPSNKSYE